MYMRNFILSVLATASACHADASERADVPDHVVVVCTGACDPAARRAAFRRWAERALDHAGSRFEVWEVGGRLGFSTEVPARWPAPVTRSRAEFIALGEDRAGRDEAAVAEGSLIAGQVEVAVPGAPELERAVRAGLAAAAPAHAELICDRSSSTLGVSCAPRAVRRSVIDWIARGGVHDGASLEVLVPGHSYDSARQVVAYRASGQGVGERVARAVELVDAVPDAIVNDRGPAGSAIAETLRVAVDHLHDTGGMRALVVLSDLRQYTPGRWNFERSVPSARAFAAWLARERLAVDLRGVDVGVCGTHHMRPAGAARFDAKLAHDVVALWSSVFHAAGADPTIYSDCEAVTRAP